MENVKLLSKIALSFQDLNKFDQQMDIILNDIGNFLDVSRIYIFFQISKDVLSNEYEWCKEGIKPQIHNLKQCSLKDSMIWIDLLKENGSICEDDIANLPEDIKVFIEPQDIKSLVAYPLTIKEEIKGFIGFDECRHKRKWKSEEIEILGTVSGIISNAYERKIFQEEISASETNFRNFFETIDDMFFVSDLKGRLLHTNQSLVKKLEYSLEELKTMNLLELYKEEDIENNTKLFNEILEGKIESCSKNMTSKSGKEYLVKTRTWFGKWNNEDCIYGISKDITQENENLELFYKIFESNPLPTVITDKKTNVFIKANPAFCDLTGYSLDELLGKTIDEFNFFTKADKFKNILKKVREQGKIKNEEFLIRDKSGKLLSVVSSIECISNQGKKSFLTVMVDVTEKTEMIKEIEDKYTKLTNIIEGTNLATWELNVQTGEVEFNEQWANMLGYTLDEIANSRSETWFKFVHEDDLKASNKLIHKHLEGETEYYDFEVRMKHRDGRWIWVHDKGKVIERDEQGRAVKMFGTLSDITLRKEINEELRENEKRFFLALDKTKAGLWDYNMLTGDVILSPMWKKIVGYEDHEIESSFESWQSLWHPDDKEGILKAQQDYLEGKTKSYENVHRLRHKDGYWIWTLSRGGVLRRDDGTAYRWIGTNTDITKEHEQALELERIFSVNLDLLCILDMEGKFIKTNKAWCDILGYKPEELIGQNISTYIHKDDIKSTMSAMKKLENNEKVDRFTNRYKSKDGHYHHLEWRANPHEGLVYGSARDVSKRIEYENKILEISNRDSLTNVYNRRYVFKRTEEIIEEYKRAGKIFTLSILDIDYFKRINDNYGHQAGDHILVEFTKLINENLRKYDILGRYGGEEFIIILSNVEEDQGKLIVDRILNIVREKVFTFNNEDIKFTFSGGIVHCTEIEKDEITIDNLVEIADQRMYEAKNTGRNKII